MKYLLILFSLTSIFANNTKFNEALENLKIEEVDSKWPDEISYVRNCLEQFTKNYKKKYDYNYALNKFKYKKNLLNNRYTCSELNQELGDKIVKAWENS